MDELLQVVDFAGHEVVLEDTSSVGSEDNGVGTEDDVVDLSAGDFE